MVYAAMSNLSVYSAAKLTNKTACNFQFFVLNKKIDAMVIFLNMLWLMVIQFLTQHLSAVDRHLQTTHEGGLWSCLPAASLLQTPRIN